MSSPQFPPYFKTEWKPDPNILNRMGQLVEQNLQPGGNQRLQQFMASTPMARNYLVFICVKCAKVNASTRQLAGVLLKNELKNIFRPPFNQTQQAEIMYIKKTLLEGLGDGERRVRLTCGNCVARFIFYHKLYNWQDIFGTMFAILKKFPKQTNLQEGIVNCIKLICEDNSKDMLDVELGTIDENDPRMRAFSRSNFKPLKFLIPLLIDLFKHPNKDVRANSIESLTHFMTRAVLPNALVLRMSQFVKGLTFLANDPDPKVKKFICVCFIHMVSHPTYLAPIYGNVVKFILACLNLSDENVSLVACEFFNEIARRELFEKIPPEQQFMMKSIVKYLPVIVPRLINFCPYDEFNRQYISDEVRRMSEVNNIAPNFAERRLKGISGEDGEEEEDVHYFALGNEWDLRRCSSEALDMFAQYFKDFILDIATTAIEPRLGRNEWWIKESGILALGAIAKGCLSGFMKKGKKIVELIYYLLRILETDTHPMILTITCWTVSRFAPFICNEATNSNPDVAKMFPGALTMLCKMLVHNNIHVQESSCSCMQYFLEYANPDIVTPHTNMIVNTLHQCLQNYPKKNRMIMFDVISNFADNQGRKVGNPLFMEKIFKVVFNEFDRYKQPDDLLISILECINVVTVHLKDGCKSYAKYLWQKSVHMIKAIYRFVKMCDANNKIPPNKDIIASSWESIGGLVETLGGACSSLLSNDFMGLLVTSLGDPNTSIRTVVFGVMGELVKSCGAAVRPYMKKTIELCVKNMDSKIVFAMSIIVNAVWCLGQIAANCKIVLPEIQQIVPAVVPPLVRLIKTRELRKALRDNLIVTFSRLALDPNCAKILAANFGHFAIEYSKGLIEIKQPLERDHTMRGACQLWSFAFQNKDLHKLLVNIFPNFASAVAQYRVPPPSQELAKIMLSVLTLYKKYAGEAMWKKMYALVPVGERAFLQRVYGIPNIH